MGLSTKFLAAAEPGLGFVILMGICTVMIGLICIIIICTLISSIVKKFAKPDVPVKASAPVPAAAPAASAQTAIPNRGELVAAIAAALAEELGTDVSAIRIHSLKKIDK